MFVRIEASAPDHAMALRNSDMFAGQLMRFLALEDSRFAPAGHHAHPIRLASARDASRRACGLHWIGGCQSSRSAASKAFAALLRGSELTISTFCSTYCWPFDSQYSAIVCCCLRLNLKSRANLSASANDDDFFSLELSGPARPRVHALLVVFSVVISVVFSVVFSVLLNECWFSAFPKVDSPHSPMLVFHIPECWFSALARETAGFGSVFPNAGFPLSPGGSLFSGVSEQGYCASQRSLSPASLPGNKVGVEVAHTGFQGFLPSPGSVLPLLVRNGLSPSRF